MLFKIYFERVPRAKISFSENIKFQFQSILAQVLPPSPLLLPFSPKPRINFRTRRFIGILPPPPPSPPHQKYISYVGEITRLKIKRKETEFGTNERNNSIRLGSYKLIPKIKKKNLEIITTMWLSFERISHDLSLL